MDDSINRGEIMSDNAKSQNDAKAIYRAAHHVARELAQVIGANCETCGRCTDVKYKCPARSAPCFGQYPGRNCSDFVLEGAMASLHAWAGSGVIRDREVKAEALLWKVLLEIDKCEPLGRGVNTIEGVRAFLYDVTPEKEKP